MERRSKMKRVRKQNLIVWCSLIFMLVWLAPDAVAQAPGDLMWHTYLGGDFFINNTHDRCSDMAMDGDGFIYIIGTSVNAWDTENVPVIPHTPNADNIHWELNRDVFVAKLDQDGLSHSYVRCLLEHSHEELLLIGTDMGGLNIYNKKTGVFTHYLHDKKNPHSIGSNIVYDIIEDDDGTIWIATLGGGLNSFDIKTGTFTKHLIDEEHPEDRNNNYVKCLFLDDRNSLWVGTRFSGIYRFDRDLNTFVPVNDMHNRIVLEHIWSIAQDQAGHLWIGTQFNGICRITDLNHNSYSFDTYGKDRGFLNQSVLKMFCDRHGTVWAGAWAGGLYKFLPEADRFTRFKHHKDNDLSLSGDHVLAIFEDNAGTLWLGTHTEGINLIQTGRWKFHPHRFTEKHNYGLVTNEVRSILGYRDNLLWIGTSMGLMKLNTQTGDYTHFSKMTQEKNGILHDAVNSICQGKDPQTLWLGTPVGITLMNTGSNSFKHFPSTVMDRSAPLNINIYQILKDTYDILWIGTSRIGLVRFDPARNEFSTFISDSWNPASVVPWLVRNIIEYDEERLYLGTSQGIQIFNTRMKKFEAFPEDHILKSLNKMSIVVLHMDSGNNLWIGTDDYGLIKYDAEAGTVTQYTEKDGLGSNNISGILEDGNKILFISTDNGVTAFDQTKNEFRNFYPEDGLHDTEFRDNAFTQTADGKMFFGGIGGFTSLIPENFRNNNFVPPVYITGFDVLHSRFQLDENMLYTSDIELNYRMKSFSISFVALNYINSKSNQYLYKLDGVDEEWQAAANNRDVMYRNINPGRYTFRVRGSNNDGIWNERGDTLSIFIKPPFWQTPLFQIFFYSLMAAILYIIIRRRFVLLKKESFIRRLYTHSLIRNQEAERKRIAAELHDSLGQDLLVIKNRIKLMLKRDRNQKKDMDQLQQICSIADESISHIRQISYNLHPYQLDKIGLTDSFVV